MTNLTDIQLSYHEFLTAKTEKSLGLVIERLADNSVCELKLPKQNSDFFEHILNQLSFNWRAVEYTKNFSIILAKYIDYLKFEINEDAREKAAFFNNVTPQMLNDISQSFEPFAESMRAENTIADSVKHPLNEATSFLTSPGYFLRNKEDEEESSTDLWMEIEVLSIGVIILLLDDEAKLASGEIDDKAYAFLNTQALLHLQEIVMTSKAQLSASEAQFDLEAVLKKMENNGRKAANRKHQGTNRIKSDYLSWYKQNHQKTRSKNQAAIQFHSRLSEHDKKRIQPEALVRHLRNELKSNPALLVESTQNQ